MAKYIGAHVSASGGVQNTPLEAQAIGARSFALFTGSSARWSSKAITPATADEFKKNCIAGGYDASVILPHDNFLINLGSPDEEKLAKSRQSFLDEMRRCEQLGLCMLNFHPGSHLGLMETEDCLDRIAESINITLDQTKGVAAILESTAGQGTNLGYRFEHLAHVIDKVDDKSRIGVCIDTCHTHSAGYDLASPEGYKATWDDFDRIIGKHYLKAIHLNDNKRSLGSRIDRHELIGKGSLGEEFFIRFVNDPRFDNMPIILETPDPDNWKNEIAWLYAQIKN